MEPDKVFHFKFRCSYQAHTSWDVYGDGNAYEVETVRPTGSDGSTWIIDSMRERFNGDAAEFEREVMGAAGVLHRWGDSGKPMNPAVVRAFNLWRQAEHAAFIAKLDGDEYRYGKLATDDPLRQAPPLLVGAHYEIGKGWVREDWGVHWDSYESGVSRRRSNWAASDRGWLFPDGQGTNGDYCALGNYLDYGPGHYRSPHAYCRAGACNCPDSQPGNVHAVVYRQAGRNLSRHLPDVESAKRWVEAQCGIAGPAREGKRCQAAA